MNGKILVSADTSRWRNLTKVQKRFVDLLTKSKSPTFMDVNEAYKKTDTCVKKRDIMQDVNVIGAIEERLERLGFGLNERLKMLIKIAQGNAVVTLHERLTDAEGGIKERHLEKNSPIADRVRAIDVMNRMADTYGSEKNAVIAAKDEYTVLADSLREEIKRKGIDKVADGKVAENKEPIISTHKNIPVIEREIASPKKRYRNKEDVENIKL